MKTIETTYVGYTNFKPARIKATDGDHTIFMSTDSSNDEAHAQAANLFANKLGWTGKLIGGGTKRGMVWVFDDKFSPWFKIKPVD